MLQLAETQQEEPGDPTESVAIAYHMKTKWDLEQMRAVALVERRRFYEQEGHNSTAEWLSNFLGIGYMSALKYVEVAMTLEECPKLADAYGAGRISYDHLRALVDVAGPVNESDLLQAVEGTSVADTFRLVRRIQEVSAEDSALLRQERWLQMRWDHESRQLFVLAQLPEEMGVKFEKAIDALAADMPDQETPMGTRRADALCEMAGAVLNDHGPKAMVVVRVDAKTLASETGVAEIVDGPTISPETARRLSCDALVQGVVERVDGKPMGMGRRRRTVSEQLFGELLVRDRHCRTPGCRSRKGLIAHHIVHWAFGGETEYDNLVLVCETHHAMIHDEKYEVRGMPPNIWIERPGRPPLTVGPPPMTDEAAALFEWECRRLQDP